MQKRPQLERKVIRGIVVVMALLALTYLGFSLLPARALYTNDTAHELVRTDRGFDRDLAIAIAILFAPAVLVWLSPRPLLLGLWGPMAIAATLFAAYAFWHLDLSPGDWRYDKRDLWPAEVCQRLLQVQYVTILLVLPVASAVYAWLTRERPPAPPVLPAARVVR